jgi:hypothetical protein
MTNVAIPARRLSAGTQEVASFKIKRRNGLHRNKPPHIDNARFFRIESFELIIGHDNVLIFFQLITAYQFLGRELFPCDGGIIASLKRCTTRSEHAQSEMAGPVRRIQVDRNVHQAKAEGATPEPSPAGTRPLELILPRQSSSP